MTRKSEEYGMTFGLLGMIIGAIVGFFVLGPIIFGSNSPPENNVFAAIIGGVIFMIILGPIGLYIGKTKERPEELEPVNSSEKTSKLEELKALYDKGILTDDEFQAKKEEILKEY